jgi:hypothetical protein
LLDKHVQISITDETSAQNLWREEMTLASGAHLTKTATQSSRRFRLITPEREAEFLRQLTGARLDQNGAIGKNNGGHAPIPVIELLDDVHGFGMAVNVNIIILDAMLAQKFFDALAIGTPDGAVNDDFIGHESSTSQRQVGWEKHF